MEIDVGESAIRSFADDFLGEDNVLDNSEVEKIRESIQLDYNCDCVEHYIEKLINNLLELREHREY